MRCRPIEPDERRVVALLGKLRQSGANAWDTAPLTIETELAASTAAVKYPYSASETTAETTILSTLVTSTHTTVAKAIVAEKASTCLSEAHDP